MGIETYRDASFLFTTVYYSTVIFCEFYRNGIHGSVGGCKVCVLACGRGSGSWDFCSQDPPLPHPEHPSLILVPWPGFLGHAEILNCLASLTTCPRDLETSVAVQTPGLNGKPHRSCLWRDLQLNCLRERPREGQLAPLSQGGGPGSA